MDHKHTSLENVLQESSASSDIIVLDAVQMSDAVES